jgi:hypothetical protein
MAVTNFSPLLGLALPTTGDLAGTWGTTVNDSITSLLDTAVAGTTTLSTDADVTLSTTNGAANQARSATLLCTGARTALRTITAPAQSKAYVIINQTTGGFAVKIVGSGPTTGVTIANGEKALVAWNGSDFVLVSAIPIDLAADVTGTLPIANGGSGATSAANARTNFGATTLGSNLFTITNPSAVTFPRFNADNTVSSLNAADFRTAIGAGTGGGSVTSVSGTGTVNGITLTGTVTSSGNLTLGGTLSGVSLTTQVSGTLPVANGGTGGTTQATARTGLGATTVGGNLFTLTNPSAVTFPRFNADNTVSALDAATFRSAIGAGTGSGNGTVTSVTVSAGSGLSGGGTVTTSGTITLTNAGVTSLSAGSGISLSGSTGAITITGTGGGAWTWISRSVISNASSMSFTVPSGYDTVCFIFGDMYTNSGYGGLTLTPTYANGSPGGGFISTQNSSAQAVGSYASNFSIGRGQQGNFRFEQLWIAAKAGGGSENMISSANESPTAGGIIWITGNQNNGTFSPGISGQMWGSQNVVTWCGGTNGSYGGNYGRMTNLTFNTTQANINAVVNIYGIKNS